MATATLTSKGQLTLPKALRDELKLKPGDKVDFVRDSVGGYRFKPANTDVRELSGFLSHLCKGPPISVEEIDEGVAKRMREKFPLPNKARRK
jgi:antitoxin PrlF